LRPGERVEVVDKDARSGQLIVARTEGENEESERNIADIDSKTGQTDAYVIETLDGTPVEFTVAPVTGDRAEPLSHEDGSVVATLREIVDDSDEERPLTALGDRARATACAHEYGLWIANVREVDPSETTTRAFSQAGADNAPETEREAN
jgi:hypothetical protein